MISERASNGTVSKRSTSKSCIVPYCVNTSRKEPGKIFLTVPYRARRTRWCEAIKNATRIPFRWKTNTSYYICEDHFNLEKDASNWMFYKTMGGKLYLKQNVVPHIFNSVPIEVHKSVKTVPAEQLPIDVNEIEFKTEVDLKPELEIDESSSSKSPDIPLMMMVKEEFIYDGDDSVTVPTEENGKVLKTESRNSPNLDSSLRISTNLIVQTKPVKCKECNNSYISVTHVTNNDVKNPRTTNNHFGYQELGKNSEAINYYTGFKMYRQFQMVFQLITQENDENFVETCNYLCKEDQFLMTLIKLKRAEPDFALGLMFGVDKVLVEKIVSLWVVTMSKKWCQLDVKPSKKTLIRYLPECLEMGNEESITFCSNNDRGDYDFRIKQIIELARCYKILNRKFSDLPHSYQSLALDIFYDCCVLVSFSQDDTIFIRENEG